MGHHVTHTTKWRDPSQTGNLLYDVSDKQQTSFAKLQMKNSTSRNHHSLSNGFWHILLNQKDLLPGNRSKEGEKLL